MSEENISQVDDKCCLDDANPMEISVETIPVVDEEVQGDDVILPAAETNHANLRPYSTDKKTGKALVQTRYRGNQTSSTHDLCKHGKRREEGLVIKPWKLVKKKNVESGDLGKGETLRKSSGNVSKPDKSLLLDAKREAAGEVFKSCDGLRVKRSETKSTFPSVSAVVRMAKKTDLDVKVSRISQNKSPKEDLSKNLKNKEKTKIDELVRCTDDVLETTNLDVKKVSRISENKSSNKDILRNKEKTKIDEPVRCDDSLEKTSLDDKKVPRISENKNLKEERLKNLKNKEKTNIDEPVISDDALEKTLYVVESSIEMKKKMSIKSVKSEIQQSSEKKILRSSGKKSLSLLPSLSPSSEVAKESRVTRSDPRPIRQTISRSKTGLSEKKQSRSANLVTNPKPESKIRPKRIGLKATPPPPPTKQQMNFKKGKVLEPKPEDSTTTSIKFKKRVVQEPKLRSDVNKKKKNLKDKREGVGKINGEGKREKVVLRHRKVEVKKKLQTLFNNVIEETVNKLEEVRKSKVKALVGAFETVISLQDNNRTSQKKKIKSKSTSSQVVEGG